MVAASRLPFGMPSCRTFMPVRRASGGSRRAWARSYHAPPVKARVSAIRSGWTVRVGAASARGGRMKRGELARALGATLEGGGEDVDITGVAGLEEATPGLITFLADRRHEGLVRTSTASAILLAPDAPRPAIPVLRVANPYAAFAHALELFHPPQRPAPGIHPTAAPAPTT